MANKCFLLSLSLSLLSLLLFNGSLAQERGQQQQYSQRCLNQCQLDNLDALEPAKEIRSEAGVTEVWDCTNQQLQCAGVTIMRRRVERNGLVLPSFSNVPQFGYVIQGRGLLGTVFPGCPETFQDSQGSRTQDQHQKIRRFREGDVIALPAGVAYWYYNNGDQPLVIVSVQDTNNVENQLDFTPRKFYLAGNPEQEFEQQQQGRGQGCNNIFCGFDRRLLAEAFNVKPELIDRIQNDGDNRGNIIRVEGNLDITMPPTSDESRRGEHGGRGGGESEGEDERRREPGGRGGRGEGGEFERRGHGNGLEETFCSMRLRANIGDPIRADVFSPQAGRISTINSFNLPILRHLQLSAEMGVLYKNAIFGPHSSLNANCVLYAIRGSARVQVVDHRGNAVFDDEVRQGRVLVVPQNFAVLKRAGDEGFEFVAFKTNDNAMTNPLVGRTSLFRGMPNDVLRNAFRLPKKEVSRLKYSRSEATIMGPSSRSGRSDA